MLGGTSKSFLEPYLLLLLREHPDHGYSLVERLQTLGMVNSDPGRVYRALRTLERDDLVRSRWTQVHSRPERRIYHLTLEGCAALGAWIHTAEGTRDILQDFLARWELLERRESDADIQATRHTRDELHTVP
jgi:PadR family transcriptional regulator PadR